MSGDLQTEWSRLLVSSLRQAGVRDVVISPGSRSTPFAWAALHDSGLRCHSVIDERAAAFFALGQARVTGEPSLLVCTSGTAGAHYYPAIIEAHESATPLIALTADRPFELRYCRSLQATDQLKLFGDFAAFFEVSHPDASPEALRALMRLGAQVHARALFPRPGPVHLNAPARKPLEPKSDEESPLRATVDALLRTGPAVVHRRVSNVPDGLADTLLDEASNARRPLIVCGALSPTERVDGAMLGSVAAHVQAAVFTEATSQLRLGSSVPQSIDALPWLLRCPNFTAAYRPDWVLELGAPLIASAWSSYVGSLSGARRHVVSAYDWSDPESNAASQIQVPVAALFEALARAVERRSSFIRTEAREQETSSWLSRCNDTARRIVDAAASTAREAPIGEASAVRLLCETAPSGSVLVLGNSLPIRHADLFVRVHPRSLRVVFQRGVNGIDGLIAGAAGAAQAAQATTTLLLGDVSFLHDVGGLEVARRVHRPLVIVVLNNGGGRIFDELPLRPSELPRETASFWTTPHDFNLEHVAHFYQTGFYRPRTPLEFETMLADAYERPGASILDVKVPPNGSAELSRRILGELDPAIGAFEGRKA